MATPKTFETPKATFQVTTSQDVKRAKESHIATGVSLLNISSQISEVRFEVALLSEHIKAVKLNEELMSRIKSIEEALHVFAAALGLPGYTISAPDTSSKPPAK